MSKPRSKTPPYTLRFDLELQELIERSAQTAGTSPRRWLESTFNAALRAKAGKEPK